MNEWSVRIPICKTSAPDQVIYGWASVSQKVGGEWVTDSHRHRIRPEALEKAAWSHLRDARAMGDMHMGDAKGELVESIVTTTDKQRAMGLAPNTLPVGWFVGYHLPDPEVFELVAKGARPMLSIQGYGRLVPVNDDADGLAVIAKGTAVPMRTPASETEQWVEDLEVYRVDLIDAGSNPESWVTLAKRSASAMISESSAPPSPGTPEEDSVTTAIDEQTDAEQANEQANEQTDAEQVEQVEQPEQAEAVVKAKAEAAEAIAKAQAEATHLAKRVAELEDRAVTAEMIDLAKGLAGGPPRVELLKSARTALSDKDFDALTEWLSSLSEQVAKGALFDELGTASVDGDDRAKIEKRAAELVAGGADRYAARAEALRSLAAAGEISLDF